MFWVLAVSFCSFLFLNHAPIKPAIPIINKNIPKKKVKNIIITSAVPVILAYKRDEILNFQLIPSRGFQSSVDYKVVFGLEQSTAVDSIRVIWPDQTESTILNPAIDTTLLLDYYSLSKRPVKTINAFFTPDKPYVKELDTPFEAHGEDGFIDFFQEALIMKMTSREGPGAATGDLNGDGLEDLFIGGASGYPAKLYGGFVGFE